MAADKPRPLLQNSLLINAFCILSHLFIWFQIYVNSFECSDVTTFLKQMRTRKFASEIYWPSKRYIFDVQKILSTYLHIDAYWWKSCPIRNISATSLYLVLKLLIEKINKGNHKIVIGQDSYKLHLCAAYIYRT